MYLAITAQQIVVFAPAKVQYGGYCLVAEPSQVLQCRCSWLELNGLSNLSFPVTTKRSMTLSGEKTAIWSHEKWLQLENMQEENEWSLYARHCQTNFWLKHSSHKLITFKSKCLTSWITAVSTLRAATEYSNCWEIYCEVWVVVYWSSSSISHGDFCGLKKV